MMQSKKLRLSTRRKKRSLIAVAIALYITFLLLSTIPFLADRAIEPEMDETYEYHLIYPIDGRQTHYYVERVDTSSVGKIDLVYTTATNTLTVETNNIEVLHIYCRSMYEDECEKVFGIDPMDNSNYFKWFFIEKNHFVVNVKTDHVIKELAFIDTPIPYKVIVNGLNWVEGRQYNYTFNQGSVLSNVPRGQSQVDLYFKASDVNRPVARISSDRKVVGINNLIYFDASKSFDPDGEIIAYIWDFGDGENSGGVVNSHSWSAPGTYGVILTVRDNDGLIDQAFLNITVIKGSNKPLINGVVPDQVKEEDSPPWELSLFNYAIDMDSSPNELKWYLTGENNDIYDVLGENSTDQKLIFTPKPNAYGNDLVTLWLIDNDGYSTSQPLCINITPVNDKPVINNLPNLVVHCDTEYRFSIINYIYDIETPKKELMVKAQDVFGNKYVNVENYELVFRYPKSLLNEVILTTVTVSDDQDYSETIISVTVTEDWPPILLQRLPDLEILEGTIKYNVFNLDEYFKDPDDEQLYYSYSESKVVIFINSNHSVDVISKGEWTGQDVVTFRARDTQGAIVEDSIKITVLPINDPPEIGDIPDLKVHYDMDYNFDLSFYITDDDNNLSELSIDTSEPKYIKNNPLYNLGIILNFPKLLLGTTSKVTITVSDGQSQTSKTINVTVIPDYPPELIRKIPDVTFNEDEELNNHFDLDVYFLDFDNDSLYYTTGNKMIEIIIDQNNIVSFSAKKDWFGTERIIFRATDPTNALVEDSIQATVLPVNDAPKIATLPKLLLNESEMLELDLLPYISDVDTEISELIITVEDPNVMVSSTKLIILGSRDLPNEVDIYISDGESMTAGILSIDLITISQQHQNENQFEMVVMIIFIIILIAIIITFGYIYRKKQKFEIEEIFVIHNSGKLLSHLYYKSHSKFDDEIFSSMFTAIQQFIEDSFTEKSKLGRSKLKSSSEPSSEDGKKPLKLNEFKVGDAQVIIEHGDYLFMAVVYNGPGANALHNKIKKDIYEIEKRFGEKLEYWSGDMKVINNLRKYMKRLIPNKKRASQLKGLPDKAPKSFNKIIE